MNNNPYNKVNYNTGTSSGVSWRNNMFLKVLSVLYFLNFILMSLFVLAQGDDCYEFCIAKPLAFISVLPFVTLLIIIFIIRRKTTDKLDKIFLWITLISLPAILFVSIRPHDIRGYLDDMYRKQALKNRDIALCDKVKEFDTQGWCIFDVVKEIGDPSLCANCRPVYYRDDCYRKMAGNLKDLSVCDNISVSDKQDDCRIFVRVQKEAGH